jgi:hypothetical protein
MYSSLGQRRHMRAENQENKTQQEIDAYTNGMLSII